VIDHNMILPEYQIDFEYEMKLPIYKQIYILDDCILFNSDQEFENHYDFQEECNQKYDYLMNLIVEEYSNH
jgi:hypothetical protein